MLGALDMALELWISTFTVTTTIITTVFLGPRGVEKGGFQQSGSTQSGAGEKETQNINVVGKNGR